MQVVTSLVYAVCTFCMHRAQQKQPLLNRTALAVQAEHQETSILNSLHLMLSRAQSFEPLNYLRNFEVVLVPLFFPVSHPILPCQ